MRTEQKAKPIVKWVGGKQMLADELVSLFPQTYHKYYEPFLGGGSVLLALQPKAAVVGDFNEWLVDTYQAVRDDWKQVACRLDQLPNTRADYLRIREVDPQCLDLFDRAAHFIYLNKTCFRGLFRVNRQGRFNVPYGEYQRAYYDPINLANVSSILKQVEFRIGDFETNLEGALAGDFVYLDPPYYKLGGYSDFNRYTKDQFREHDHTRLANVCRELDKRGVKWALSNSNTDLIRDLYREFVIQEITNRREINLQSQERTVTELLITNYAPASNSFPLFANM